MMMTKDEKDIGFEIREHEIENILGRTPGYLLRIGIMVIFGVFLIILAGSLFFSYPDRITAKVVVTTEVEPIPLVVVNGGKIGRLLVGDNRNVEAGTIVAVLENAANTDDMIYLTHLLYMSGDSVIVPEDELRLGEVQDAFSAWKYDRVAYANFCRLQYHAKSIRGLEQQLEYLRNYITHGEQQNCYLTEQLELEEKKYRSDCFLADRNVIAEAELDKAKMELLQRRSGTEANQAAIADSRIRMIQLRQNILDLQLDYEKQQKMLRDQIIRNRELLLGQIKAWEQKYIIRSPHSGRLVYTRYWVPGEFVTAGENMFTLLLKEKGKYVGRIELPMAKSGKVKVGQEVHIRLDNYPYMEYGLLKGSVSHFSPVSNKEIYRVDVSLPDGLTGSYSKELPYLQGMSGLADIITEKQTVLQRLFFPLKSLILNHSKQE